MTTRIQKLCGDRRRALVDKPTRRIRGKQPVSPINTRLPRSLTMDAPSDCESESADDDDDDDDDAEEQTAYHDKDEAAKGRKRKNDE